MLQQSRNWQRLHQGQHWALSQWGSEFLFQPQAYEPRNKPDTRVIDDIALDLGSVTLFKYIPGLLTTPKSMPFQMKAWRSNFQVNWRRKSYVCAKGGSKFMKTIWVKWQVLGMILVHLHVNSQQELSGQRKNRKIKIQFLRSWNCCKELEIWNRGVCVHECEKSPLRKKLFCFYLSSRKCC